MKSAGVTETLREKVYEYLKEQIASHKFKIGEFINLNVIAEELNTSRTPLRDALLLLESEGFITIYPRRGVMLNSLDLRTIKNIYEIIGALESAALICASLRFTDEDVRRMSNLNDLMQEALKKDDYDTYYLHNVAFHDVFLDMSENEELIRSARIQRERLYDFPMSRDFLKEWEQSNLREHGELVALLERGNFNAAAEYLRDVHWSFSVQERFIRKYYFSFKNGPNNQPDISGEF